MRVLVAPDGFKGGPSAILAAKAMAQGIVRAGGEADVMPMADGGEGTQDALRATFPQMLQIPAKRVDAYGRLGRGHYVRLGRTALVEASVGSGFIEASQRPQGALETTSLGTGQLVQAALSDPEVDDVVVALGGTGSVDAGLGFLSGLGLASQST